MKTTPPTTPPTIAPVLVFEPEAEIGGGSVCVFVFLVFVLVPVLVPELVPVIGDGGGGPSSPAGGMS